MPFGELIVFRPRARNTKHNYTIRHEVCRAVDAVRRPMPEQSKTKHSRQVVCRRIESGSASERFSIEPQSNNRPTSRSTRAAGGAFSVFHVAGRRRVTLDVGRSTTEPQSTTSPPRARCVDPVRSLYPRLLDFDSLLKRSLTY